MRTIKQVMGANYLKEPKHKHDCEKCKFLFCVEFHLKNGSIDHADVYQSCDNRCGETPYLIRYSSDLPDYATMGLKQLAFHYVIDCKGLNR